MKLWIYKGRPKSNDDIGDQISALVHLVDIKHGKYLSQELNGAQKDPSVLQEYVFVRDNTVEQKDWEDDRSEDQKHQIYVGGSTRYILDELVDLVSYYITGIHKC